MPNTKRHGGRPLALTTVYNILGNPYYAGHFYWNGRLYPGKQEPVITMEEFARLRKQIGRAGTEKPQTYSFPFTGLIRCGACGLMVTAEHKRNRYGSRYVYYHCTKRNNGPRCSQPSIEAKELERQLAAFVEKVAIDDAVGWAGALSPAIPLFVYPQRMLYCALVRDMLRVCKQHLIRSILM